jgi:hypothetical protein
MDGMRPYALLACVLLLPTAVGYAIVATLHGSRRLAESRRRPPAVEPVERLAATLRRLRAQLEAIEVNTGIVGKNLRVQALRGAYLDALGEACARLEVSPPPGGDRALQADIYRAEAALRERGLDVRETAAR